MRISHLLLCAAISVLAQSALACETEPDFFVLPSETGKEARVRTEKTHDDQWVVRWNHEETYVFKQAPIAYIAKVVSVTKPSFGPGEITWPSSIVEPLTAIKGDMPRAPRKLVSKDTGGSCTYIGDGSGAFALVGQLIFVFEGLPKSQSYPNGIQSFGAAQARTFELLDPLAKHLRESDSKQK